MTPDERAEAIWELRKFWWVDTTKGLELIKQHLVSQAAEEREACAQIAEDVRRESHVPILAAEIRDRIRARGNGGTK